MVATIVRLVDPPDGNVYVTVALGTPIASPVWQLTGAPGVDSASYDLISPGQPNIMTDGTTIYIWWIQTDDPTFTYSYNQIRLTQTLGATPLTGWSASTYFDFFLTHPAPLVSCNLDKRCETLSFPLDLFLVHLQRWI